MDPFPGRKWHLGAALGEKNLGTEGRDAGVDPCLQLEEDVGLRSARLPLGRAALPVVVPDAPGELQRESLIGFLKDLKRHLRGQKAILVWDGLPAHKSREMQVYLLAQKSWLEVERLPGYSPDLNPVEDLWSDVKGQELQ